MEEFGVKAKGVSGLTVIAWEGVVATLLMLVLVFPFLWFLPGDDHGHVEDPINALVMLSRSWLLVLLTIGLQVTTVIAMVSGILTTKYLTSVHRMLLDSLRSAAVWVFGLCA